MGGGEMAGSHGVMVASHAYIASIMNGVPSREMARRARQNRPAPSVGDFSANVSSSTWKQNVCMMVNLRRSRR